MSDLQDNNEPNPPYWDGIVSELRYDQMLDCGCFAVKKRAADEIERLEARVAELEKTNRWLRSLAFISHTDHYEKPPYQWTITFKSSCTTIENALKQALKD